MDRWDYVGWALVTGASAGLGRVFADRLAERGMHLILSGRRDERLRALADELSTRYGIEAVPVPADLGRPAAGRRLWEEASSGRTIRLLVNNAGFGIQAPFDEVELDRHLDLVAVNCVAAVELAHCALREMRPRRSGGIRVLALCPGRTPTEFQAIAGTGSAEGAFGHRTPEQVVDAGLRAFERGRSYDVPGLENLAASWAVRALPRGTVLRAMRRISRRLWT